MFCEGGCSCGELRYGLKTKPVFVHACHCRLCQRLTGGAFVMNAIIEKDAVELLSGTPVSHRLQGGSGSDHDVYFCRNCGTYVWSEYHRFPGSAWFIRVGTLDNPDLLAPDVHIFTRSKHPAVQLPTDVPAFDISYDREQLWPAESLARLKAMKRAD
ncbi:MAG: GFA family protein [SAR324 cluster bacterium]|nr:GFA family protein [SAR324 cluster bacterium]